MNVTPEHLRKVLREKLFIPKKKIPLRVFGGKNRKLKTNKRWKRKVYEHERLQTGSMNIKTSLCRLKHIYNYMYRYIFFIFFFIH